LITFNAQTNFSHQTQRSPSPAVPSRQQRNIAFFKLLIDEILILSEFSRGHLQPLNAHIIQVRIAELSEVVRCVRVGGLKWGGSKGFGLKCSWQSVARNT
jgi:hypothetical protein